jgi:hypothetical protein
MGCVLTVCLKNKIAVGVEGIFVGMGAQNMKCSVNSVQDGIRGTLQAAASHIAAMACQRTSAEDLACRLRA